MRPITASREDRTVGWYGMRTQQRKHKITREGCLPAATELRRSSHGTHRVNCQKCRMKCCSFEYDLARMSSTVARAPFVNHFPSLPRTQARGTCRLVLSSSVFAKAGARIQATHAVFVLTHLEHALFHWYTENLGELCCLGRACDLVGRCTVGDTRSGGWCSKHSSRFGRNTLLMIVGVSQRLQQP